MLRLILMPVHPEYFLLSANKREGPYSEHELLDLLAAKEVSPQEMCLQQPSGEQRPVGEWFVTIEPELENPALHDDAEGEPDQENDDDEDDDQTDFTQWTFHPSWLAFAPWLLTSAALAWLVLKYADQSPKALAAGLGTSVLLLAMAALLRHRVTFIVNSDRVELRSGWILKSSSEIRLTDVHSMVVNKTGFLGLLGVGNIGFSSSDNGREEIVFQRVRGVERIKQLVRTLQA